MPMQRLIGRLRSPSFRAIAEIVQTYQGLVLIRHQTVHFPRATLQLWAFGPDRQDRLATTGSPSETVVVAVRLRNQQIDAWKPLDMSFEGALAHYRQAAGRYTPPAGWTLPEPAGMPPGIRAVLPQIGTAGLAPARGRS